MAESFWKIGIYPQQDGKFSVVCEWSEECALTFTRPTLDEVFAVIREELSKPREFSLVAQAVGG